METFKMPRKQPESAGLWFSTCQRVKTLSRPSSGVRNIVRRILGYRLPRTRQKSDVIIFVSANACDMFTTWVALDKGGSEGNPFLTEIFKADTNPELLIYKIIFVTASCVLFRNHTRLLRYVGYGLVFVCIWNASVLISWML